MGRLKKIQRIQAAEQRKSERMAKKQTGKAASPLQTAAGGEFREPAADTAPAQAAYTDAAEPTSETTAEAVWEPNGDGAVADSMPSVETHASDMARAHRKAGHRLGRKAEPKSRLAAPADRPAASVVAPTFGLDGRARRQRRGKSHKKLIVAAVILAAVAAFLYLPQFFMGGGDVGAAPEVSFNAAALRLSNSALRNGQNEDFDGDGMTASEEASHNTNAWAMDTDWDGLPDRYEIRVSNTDPTKADMGQLVSIVRGQDAAAGAAVDTPYVISGVTLWADSYSSKAHGSVVQTPHGYRFCGFSGYAKLPDSDGRFVMRYKNGVHIPLTPTAEGAYKVADGDVLVVVPMPPSQVVRLRAFGAQVYLEDGPLAVLLDAILPQRGFITAVRMLDTDADTDADSQNHDRRRYCLYLAGQDHQIRLGDGDQKAQQKTNA